MPTITSRQEGRPGTQRWEAAIKPLVDSHPDACPTAPETDDAADLIDFDRNRPLQRIIFMMDPTDPNYRDEMIPVGNVIWFLTTETHFPGDFYTVNTEGYAVQTGVAEVAREALDLIAMVPNPYMGISDYELSREQDVVRFTNMPQIATIRVFTVSGTLVWIHHKDGLATSVDWNLANDFGRDLASGVYLVHIEAPGIGERVLKLGVVKKRR